MAKDRAQPEREVTTVAASIPTANKLRALADRHDITITEALDRFGGPAIHKEWQKLVKEMSSDPVGGEA